MIILEFQELKSIFDRELKDKSYSLQLTLDTIVR